MKPNCCQNENCKSKRIVNIGTQTSACVSKMIGKLAVCGDVPQDMNISGKEDGSYLLIQFCLDCGQMQGKWPVGKTAYENT